MQLDAKNPLLSISCVIKVLYNKLFFERNLKLDNAGIPEISILISWFFDIFSQLYTIFLPILVILLSSHFILCAFGGLKTRSIKVMLYLTLIIPCQVFGYGLGFLQAFIRRYVFNEDTLTGFKKNYYKWLSLFLVCIEVELPQLLDYYI